MSVEGGVASTIAGGVAATCLAGAVTYSVLAPYMKCTVNCHFCNYNAKVARSSRNSWTCPSCDQYNGFTEDGDYNKPMDFRTPATSTVTKPKKPAENGLCRKCNLNQELKISQLSSFTGEGRELEEYKDHLERVYRLCGSCDEFLANRLSSQDSILAPGVIEHKLETSRLHQWEVRTQPSPALRFLRDSQILVSIVLFCVLSQPSLNVSYVRFLPLRMIALLENVASELSYHSEFIRMFLVILLALLSTCLIRVKPESLGSLLLLASAFLNLSPVLQLTGSGLFATVVLLAPIRISKQSKPGRKRRIVDTYSSRFIESDTEDLDREESDSNLSRSSGNKSFTGVLTESASLLFSNLQTPAVNVSPVVKINSSPPLNYSSPVFGPRISSPMSGKAQLVKMSSPILRSGEGVSLNHEFSIDNSRDCDLASLTLGEEEPVRVSRADSHFSPRLYSPENSSGIRFNPSRPVLKPSKLASWVAGGYWTPPTTQIFGETISRSSSQSSGFVSASVPSLHDFSLNQPLNYASLPSSPVNSVYGDVDRFSVLSEPMMKLQAPISGPGFPKQFVTPRRSTTCDGSESSLDRVSQAAGLTSLMPPRAQPSSLDKPETKNPNKGLSFTVTITPVGVLLTASLAVNLAVIYFVMMK